MVRSAYSQSARRQVSRHVSKHRKEGMPQDQAVAAALSEARRKGKKVPARRKASKTRRSATKQKSSSKRSRAGRTKSARSRSGSRSKRTRSR